jgi:integrase/recombinase XerD
MLLCLSGLGLRPCEVADLRLDDIDWHAGTLQVRAHKTRRDAALPLPRDVGGAIVAYLRAGRPRTSERRVFVQHRRAARGAALGRLAVTHAVARALRRADVQAPMFGAYVLRHTFASRLVRQKASIKEVADYLGHRSLETTAIYAKLDLTALREVVLPWPEVTP